LILARVQQQYAEWVASGLAKDRLVMTYESAGLDADPEEAERL
jgi:hypothetical protein